MIGYAHVKVDGVVKIVTLKHVTDQLFAKIKVLNKDYTGKCISEDGKDWACKCVNGYAPPYCENRTCDDYTGCNHG